MELLKGLTTEQTGALRHIRNFRKLDAGREIFVKGAPASSLYVVASGQVQIFVPTLEGDLEVARLGPNEVFGDLGLIVNTQTRTASARAVEETVVMEITPNPIDLFKSIGQPEAAIQILQNLICILAARLQKINSPDWVPVKMRSVPVFDIFEPDTQQALKTIDESLPHGLFHIFDHHKKLAAGEFLCHEGDEPDGFFFVHEGELEVSSGGADAEERTLGTIAGPTIAGELGFFTGEPRGATLHALTDVVYTHFSGSYFKKLKKSDPEGAFNVLFAAAQLAVHLFLERQDG